MCSNALMVTSLRAANVYLLALDGPYERFGHRIVQGADRRPIDSLVPCSRIVLPGSSDMCCAS